MRGQVGRECLRAITAGYIDAYAVINFSVFTSFMSGNTITTGVALGRLNLHNAGRDLLPVPLFVIGCCAGSLLNSYARAWRYVANSTVLVTVLIAGCAFMSVEGARIAYWIALLSFAMGVFSTTTSRVGNQPVSFGFVTGDLKSLGDHLAAAFNGVPISGPDSDSDSHRLRASILFAVWACFLAGAVLGAVAEQKMREWTLVPSVAALVMLSAISVGQSDDPRRRNA